MEKITKDVLEEVKRASERFPEYNSPHEGYAIIAEELDELWDEIKEKNHNLTQLYNEAKQVACTSFRFMKMVEKMKKESGVIT